MKKSKTIAKTILFSPKLIAMGEEIEQEKGYMSFSAVVHQGLIALHRTTFPAYAQITKDQSPEAKVRRKEEEKEAVEKMEFNKRAKICEELGGSAIDKSGTIYCVYYTYSQRVRYEQKLPMSQLNLDVPKNQYSPSREKVEALQKAGKTDY